jgi:hypothetical protein
VTPECLSGEYVSPHTTTNPSTGDPANPGWRRIGASFPAHEGQSLLVVDISAEPSTGTDDNAAVLIDAVNVNIR